MAGHRNGQLVAKVDSERMLQLAYSVQKSLFKEVLHADLSLSSRTDSFWASHLLSALDGQAQLDMMRRQIVACDPVNLSQFVVDLRSRHLSSWN
eukprot:1151086-Pelagomonas_calceolata.AAC.1